MTPCTVCGSELEPVPDAGWLCPAGHTQAATEMNAAAEPATPDAPVCYGFMLTRGPDGQVLVNAPGGPPMIVLEMLERSLVVAKRWYARVEHSRKMSAGAKWN